MPAKNIVKPYVENGFYHIYNRGVEKRDIFLDEQDYRVFLSYLKTALLPPLPINSINFTLKGSTFKGIPKQPKNFYGLIELVAYTLMPNHFHMLIQQHNSTSITTFMQSICTRYSMYINKKYKRVGALFQSIYKGALINDEPYLLHLTRYIHRNPLKISPDFNVHYSSYLDYLGMRNTPWIKPQIVLSFFDNVKHPFLKRTNTYKSFVEQYEGDGIDELGDLILEEEL